PEHTDQARGQLSEGCHGPGAPPCSATPIAVGSPLATHAGTTPLRCEPGRCEYDAGQWGYAGDSMQVEGEWTELADGVFARRHGELDLTTGLLVGTERCLVIDTRGDLEQGAELAAAVRSVTSLPWTVVYTHAHFDHAWGGEAFLPTHVWGHRDCAHELLTQSETVRAEWIAHYRGEGKFDTADALARTTLVP